jgi:GTP cyclohydrolase I
LTRQVLEALQELLGTDDVAVVLDAKHLCVSSRGIQDESSSTVTASYGGVFDNDADTRNEFLTHVGG